MPAPLPPTAWPAEKDKISERPAGFYDKEKAPPDNAPLEDLVDYWERWASAGHFHHPSETVEQRLLEACLEEPERLPPFLSLFSGTETTAARLKELYDVKHGDESHEYWRDAVQKWLVFNSKYFLADLLALVGKVKDKEKYGSVENGDALSALARVDWETAEPVLNRLVAQGQARTRALALTLLYRHAVEEKNVGDEDRYRSALKVIAEDRNAPAHARNYAIEALSLAEWSGRDEWYLSLFYDETLLDPSDGNYGFSPLTSLFVRDPDKWIPVMSRLVEGKDQTARSAAATCLIVFQNEKARKDALQPLLPWLSNPAWAMDKRGHRLSLIQSLDNVDLPESVPGLIWAVEHDDSEFSLVRSYGAQALARYRDLRAAPVLKKALAIEKEESRRGLIIQGLLASGGLTEAEQLEALETYAARLTTVEGRASVEYRNDRHDPLPVPLSIGSYLSRASTVELSASLVRSVLARPDKLQKTDPLLARSLLEIAHKWRGRQIDLDLIARIGAGTANPQTIAEAIERRKELSESLKPEVQALIGIEGLPQGVAAVLLEDSALAQSLLASGSQLAQAAVLVCARLTSMSLPVEAVGSLMKSRDQLLAEAAERYLLAEDSREARELLWARHPGQAFITGWRENIELSGGDNFDDIGKIEEKLKAELFKENPPLEIYALVANVESYSYIVRVYQNRAVYSRSEDPSRYLERAISKEELSTFKSMIRNNVEDLGPQIDFCHHHCLASEFLVLTKEKGRRVFSHQGGWGPVVTYFDSLGRGDNARARYTLENEIEGLEVLHSNDKLLVKDVWQAGADVRVFVEREETPEESEEQLRDLSIEDEDEAANAERRRRQLAREQNRFSWRTFAHGKIGAKTAQPKGFLIFDQSRLAGESGTPSFFDQRQVQFVTDDTVVVASNFEGLWKITAGQGPIRISVGSGAYGNPIVTSDRKWVVVAKTDTNWGVPNYIARFNLQTGFEYRVALPPADQFDPIAHVAPHGKVLLRRAKDDEPSSKSVGPRTPEYYLLDASTGQTQLVFGVFTPLHQVEKRFLQPTGKPNEFWAAIPDHDNNQTKVGRYNLKDFSFQELLVVPHLSFDSMAMWIDEASEKFYVVYEGQLLRLALRRTSDNNPAIPNAKQRH